MVHFLVRARATAPTCLFENKVGLLPLELAKPSHSQAYGILEAATMAVSGVIKDHIVHHCLDSDVLSKIVEYLCPKKTVSLLAI